MKTGQVNSAVRTTCIDGMDITEGDIMGIGDKGMLAVGKSVDSTTLDMLQAMIDEESELVTIYYGSEVTEEELPFCLTRPRRDSRNVRLNFRMADSRFTTI